MISVQVKSQEAQRMLNKLAGKLHDRRAVNKALAAKLFQMTMDNFEDEAHEGAPWAALAPSTVAWKERHGYVKMLQNTGALRQSFLPFSDNELAGIGSLSSRKHADISKIHEEGSGRIPARKMLPSMTNATKEAINIYDFFVKRNIAFVRSA